MKYKMKLNKFKNNINIRFLILVLVLIVSLNICIFAQVRIAVLPFQNMDGKIEKNIICYELQDSIFKELKLADPESKFYYVVPADSVEDVLATLNLDPSNPQYTSDLWKAVKILNIKKVISGNFNIQGNKILLNGYIYDARMKLADPKNQVRDIFKDEDKVLEAVDLIVKSILPAIKPND